MLMVLVRHESTGHRYDHKLGEACNDNVLKKAYEAPDDQIYRPCER
jgi:hypothetical protein